MTYQKNSSKVRRYAGLMRFGTWLQKVPQRAIPAPFRLLQIGSAFWQSRALHLAAEWDIATVLGAQCMPIELLAQQIHANPDALYRMMRFLASIGVFEECKPRHFQNNATSHPLRNDHLNSVRAMVLLHGSKEMTAPWWDQLDAGIRSSAVPFEKTHGEDLFSYLQTHPAFGTLFAQAMDSVQALTGPHFATDFDWTRFDRVIDVGGSQGSKSLALLRQHQHLRALVTDRAQVVEGAQEKAWATHGKEVASRISFKAADALHGIEPAHSARDIYLLCAVLHGLDDAQCLQLLDQLALAIGASNARVAIMEMVLPECGASTMDTSFDMQMLVGTRGRERTLSEWNALFAKAGFTLDEQVQLQSPGTILVLRRE